MSCSVHDVIRLEKAGIPTVNVATRGFISEGEEQSKLLGMPDYRVFWVPHPVATLDAQQIESLARSAAEAIVARLTTASAGPDGTSTA